MVTIKNKDVIKITDNPKKDQGHVSKMKLKDYFKLGNLKSKKNYDILFVNNNSFSTPLNLWSRFNLILSLISLKLALKKFVVFLFHVDGKVEGINYLVLVNKKAEFGVFINEKYRGMGFGTRLTEKTTEWCKSNGYEMWLTVYDWNKNAIKLYENFGLKIYQKSYYMK